MNAYIEKAQGILRANDKGGYTVPTARLYPFQWNWDSAFVAMGWQTFDEAAAWREVESLLKGQWDDGMVPHIVFHTASDQYFPGPDVWGTHHAPSTSGITQPPVLASAVARLVANARDKGLAEAKGAAIYRQLLANHRWWSRAYSVCARTYKHHDGRQATRHEPRRCRTSPAQHRLPAVHPSGRLLSRCGLGSGADVAGRAFQSCRCFDQRHSGARGS